MRRNQQGQVTAESAVLFSFVIAGFVFMGFYLQRAAQGSTKANTDAIGTQFTVNSPWNNQATSQSFEKTDATTGQVKTTSVSCSHGAHGFGAAIPADDEIGWTDPDCNPLDYYTDTKSVLRTPN